jgi:hypothetical protein
MEVDLESSKVGGFPLRRNPTAALNLSSSFTKTQGLNGSVRHVRNKNIVLTEKDSASTRSQSASAGFLDFWILAGTPTYHSKMGPCGWFQACAEKQPTSQRFTLKHRSSARLGPPYPGSVA